MMGMTVGPHTNNSNEETYSTASVGFNYAGDDGMSFTGAIERFSSTDGVNCLMNSVTVA